MHMCSLGCGDLFSSSRGVRVASACGAASYDREKFASACSSFALRSCTACPCSYTTKVQAWLSAWLSAQSW